MPQPPPKAWKKVIFQSIALAEKCLRGKPISDRGDLRQIRNFLVLQYESPLGSVVHATPLFEALKTAIPHAHITVAASSMAASVLGNSPYIDRCVITPNPFTNFLKARAAVRSLYQTMPPGQCALITTIGNRAPRLTVLNVLAANSIRIGYTMAPQLYSYAMHFSPARSQIDGNLDIVRTLGYDVSFLEPRLFFSAPEAAYVERLLASAAADPIAGSLNPRIAFVTQNSGGQRNRWPAERFQQVVVSLSRTSGAAPVFIGTSADTDVIERLRGSLPQSGISLAGKTTVSQLAATLAQCDLVVSLDTGPFHVARAVGLPGVVLAPAWQNPMEWLPHNNRQYKVLRGASISAPPLNYRLEEIEASAVTAAAVELLRDFPPSIESRTSRLSRSILVQSD